MDIYILVEVLNYFIKAKHYAPGKLKKQYWEYEVLSTQLK